jgi:tRNA A-37 threonylcarbamoyl transferase component Bud32
LRYPDAPNLLDSEAHAYVALENLQGKVIPKLYGFYEIWRILQLIALEPVGTAIPEDEQINQTLCMKMKTALQCIHNAGFVHGDIACCNFCRRASGVVFLVLVDLERCQCAGNQSELDNEMNEVDGL